MPYGGVCLLKGMPYEGFDSRLDSTISTDHASHPKKTFFYFIRLKSKKIYRPSRVRSSTVSSKYYSSPIDRGELVAHPKRLIKSDIICDAQ